MFSLFGLEESGKGRIFLTELAYYCSFFALQLVISLSKVRLGTIIQINGAVLAFCFIYLLPVLMHVRCLYFSEGIKMPLAEGEEGTVVGEFSGKDASPS